MKYQGQAIRVVTAEIQRQGRYLILRRPPDKLLPDLWEFPGGRVKDDEQDEKALARKLRDLLGVEAKIGARLLSVDHPYEQYSVNLRHYHVDLADQELRPKPGREYAWVAPDEFEHYKFPPADEQTVALLVQEME